ncbi:MAG TPA: hypothetical protein VK796_08410, partial [Cytophaga sp.]|nr:hypothetical protein [Cytophaga sp.]
MKTTLFYLLSLNFLILFSCSKNDNVNKFVLLFDYDSTEFFFNKVYVGNNFDEEDLNNSFTFKLNDEILENGDFESGIKTGLWHYNNSNNNNLNISWRICHYSDDVLISLPPKFREHYADSLYFLGWFENQDSLNNFFVVYKNSLNGSVTLEKFWQINTNGSLKDNVTFYQCIEMRVDGKKMYLSKYTKQENGKGYTVLNLILEHNENIYDISIKDASGNETKELFIFFEMIRNIKIKDQKIFNYV